jgi:hypothetical protein
VGAARAECLRDYARCAEECERTLAVLHDDPERRELRSDLIVCAAVCRVSSRALEDGSGVAPALLEYSVHVCRRCSDLVLRMGLEAGDELARACTDAAEAAATLLLIA